MSSDLFTQFASLPQERRGDYGWGRLAAAFAILAAVAMTLTMVVGTVFAMWTPETGASSPIVMVGQLAAIAVWIPVVWLVARTLFGMRAGDLMSGRSAVRWGLFAKAAGIALVGLGGYAVYHHISSGAQVVAMTPAVIAGILAAIVLMPLQSLAEELVFRGFGPQVVLGKIGVSTLTTVVVSLAFSALFATFHGASDATAWAVFFIFGAVFATLVRITGGLEAAWALHSVNNVLFVVGGILRGQDLTAVQSDVTVGLGVFIQLAVMILVAVVVAAVARGHGVADTR